MMRNDVVLFKGHRPLGHLKGTKGAMNAVETES